MSHPPVVVVESGGVPRTQVAEGGSAPAFTVVESGARPITLADNAPPIALFNEDGTPYTGGGVVLPAFSSLIGHSFGDQGRQVTSSLSWQAGNGYPIWTSLASGGAIEFPVTSNFSVSGTTSAEILADQVPLAAAAPETCVFITGPTNDQRSSNNVAAETTIANLQAIIDGLPGKTIILTTIWPGGDAAYPDEVISTDQLANRLAVNEWIRSIRSSRVIVVDVWDRVVDPDFTDGRAKAGYLKDGIHPTQFGFYDVVAACVLPAIQGRLRSRDVLPTSLNQYIASTNPDGWLNTNPLMSGSQAISKTTGGASVSGNVPTGWDANGSGAAGLTSACSVGNDGARNYLEIATTGTLASDGYIWFNQYIAGSNLASGDVLQAFGEIEVASGQVGLGGVASGVLIRNDANATVIEGRGGGAGSANGNVPDEDIDGPLIAPRVTLPSATFHANNSRAGYRLDFRAGTVDATVRLYRMGAKKIVA